MARNSLQHTYKRAQDNPTTTPSGLGASQGRPREANSLLTRKGKQRCVCRLAYAWLLGWFQWPKKPHEGRKGAPRRPQHGLRSASELQQETNLRAPMGGR
eukprot:6787952-Pyramimonas_sp.AAC.1